MPPISAVVTTGIYCRPGCPAKPLPGNVRPFESAAAAEAAGFRACMRCRPYRSPQVYGEAAPELVCRAVHLIVGGYLDEASEAELGRRLGVSPRHLRRLFALHVGATPDQLARSRRAHFARRLLDDTDMPVIDVAFASGFGSVRQLNRAAVEIFHATPSELRARRRRADRLAADGGLVLRLPVDGPLAWDDLLGHFAARAIPGVESVGDGWYRRTAVIDGDPGVLEVGPDPAEPHDLLLRLHLPHWEGLIHVVERARRIFGLDAPLASANAALADDTVLGPLVDARPGLRPPGCWDPFETGVRAILGQQVSVAGATTLAGRLVARFGTPVPGLEAFGLTHTFPGAEEIASVTPEDVAAIGMPVSRGRAINGFARAVAEGDIPVDGSASLDDFVAAVVAVPGLGPWTAHYLAMRIGEADAFPATDLGLRHALAAVKHEGADQWRPYRSFAAIHLWMAA